MNGRILMDVDVIGQERTELFDLLTSCGFSLYRIGRELEPIQLAPRPSLPSTREGHNRLKARPGLCRALSSAKSCLKNMLPPTITSALGILLYRYLCVPIQWFKAPQQTREIYAVKPGDAAQSG